MLDGVVAHLVTRGVDVPSRPTAAGVASRPVQVTGLLREGPAVLTIEGGDQPRQILPGRPPRLQASETVREPGVQPVQLTRPPINLDRRHVTLNEPIIDTSRLLSAVAVLQAGAAPRGPEARRRSAARASASQAAVTSEPASEPAQTGVCSLGYLMLSATCSTTPPETSPAAPPRSRSATSSVPDCWRSGTSLMKRMAISASAMSGVAMRKMWPTASP